MLCLPVGLQPAEIPRPRVGANSPTPCDVCTKLSVGPFVCVISSAHAELSLSGTRPNCPRYNKSDWTTSPCAPYPGGHWAFGPQQRSGPAPLSNGLVEGKINTKPLPPKSTAFMVRIVICQFCNPTQVQLGVQLKYWNQFLWIMQRWEMKKESKKNTDTRGYRIERSMI